MPNNFFQTLLQASTSQQQNGALPQASASADDGDSRPVGYSLQGGVAVTAFREASQ